MESNRPLHRHLAQGDFVYRESFVPTMVRSDRLTLVDSEGRRYLDAEAANGAAILGYDHALSTTAMSNIANLPALPSFLESDLRLRVAERIAKYIHAQTGSWGRVAFDLGGAQGIELALKMAQLSNPKGKLVVFEGGYHGRSMFTTQLSARQRYRRPVPSATLPVERLPLPDCDRCRFQREPQSCHVECGAYARARLGEEFGGIYDGGQNDISALVFEPILNVAGMSAPDPRYLQQVVAEVRHLGGLIIADEVFTGMHRTGPLFGFQHFNLAPDIVVFSKGLTNGVTPLSCVWAREPLASPDVFVPGTHSATYINAPFALSMADVVLDALERMPAAARVRQLEAVLQRETQSFQTCSLVQSVTTRGATVRIKLRGPHSARIRAAALRMPHDAGHFSHDGLIVASTGMTNDVIALHPPLTTTEQEARSICHMLCAALFGVAAELEIKPRAAANLSPTA